MADRLPQYPMLPSFTPIQQQQLQQHQHQQSQQQQAQQQQHQAQQQHLQQLQQHNNATNQQLQEQHAGMQQNQPSMDQSRAWQQMYQLQHNRQNGGDMNPSAQLQMADMMKRQMVQNHNQAAQRQQMLQNQQAAQQQQGFMPTMGGGPITGTSSQQPPFHEPTASHPQSGHMAPAFPNISAGPAGNVNQGPSVPRTPQQQPNVLQRQLELMNAAQNQQNQNGPVKMSMQQQQQLNQLREREHQQQQAAQQQHQHPFQQSSGMSHNPGDIFSQGMSNDAIRRSSPHPGPIQQTPSGQAGPSQPNLMMQLPPNLQMQRTRVMQLEMQLSQLSRELGNIRGQPTPEEQIKMGRLKEMSELYRRNKEMMQRAIMAFSAQRQQQLSGGMNASGGVAPGPGPGSQPPGWNGPQQPFGPDAQAMRNQTGALAGQPGMPSTTPMQASASLPHSLSQNMIQQGTIPPRTGPTPQQPLLMGGQPASNPGGPSQPQHGNFTSPFNNSANLINSPFPFPPNGSQGGAPGSAPGPSQLQPGIVGGGNPAMSGITGIPPQLIKNIAPLEKARFDGMYRNFLQKMHLPSSPVVIDGRTIDPHRLHVEAMKEGGLMAIESKDLWTVIGARLGFMQFPGSDTEPARSGPVIGQQIQNCYKTQIAPFDHVYITQTLKQQQHMQQQQQAQQQQQQQQQQRPSQPPDAGSLFNLGLAGLSPQALGELVRMSQISVADLKAQNVEEKTIQYVEHNRATLQRHLQDQKLFSAQLKVRSQAEQGNMPPGGPAVGPRPPGLAAPPFPQGSSGPSTMMMPQQQQQLMMQRQALQQQQQQQMQMHLGPQGQRVPLPHTGPQNPGQMPHQAMLPNAGPGQGMLKTPMEINASGHQLLQKMKTAYMTDAMSKTAVDVPPESRMEFNQILETLHRQTTDMEVKMASVAALVGTQGPQQQEAVRRFVAIVATIHAQRQALSTSTPRFLMDLPTLKNMTSDFGRVMEVLQSVMTSLMRRGMNPQQHQAMAHQQKLQQLQLAQAAQQQQQLSNRIPMMPQPPNLPGPMQQQQSAMQMQQQMQPVPPHPPQQQQQQQSSQQQQQQQQQQPPPPYQHIQQQMQPPINGSLRQPPALLQPPMKRKAQGNGSVSSPSPAPMQVSTPAASAPTPTATASSPPAGVKSPKARATPKTKPAIAKARRPSKVVPPNPSSAAPVVEQSPSANGSTGGKRQREEDGPDAATPGASSIAGEPSPPKRAKTEWESEPTEELKKQEEAVENVKTEEDASAFLDQFTEFFKVNPSDSLTSGLSESIDMFLKGYPGDLPGGMLTSEASGSSMKKEPSPPPEATLDQFFDFTGFAVGGDQEDFKAPTPDLSSSASSTNPSPESNHEIDASHHALSAAFHDIKTEDTASMLGVGPWKDIDAGEGIFFQPTSWSWETTMPSLDPPWAISNS